jgi:hypothetical protein
MVFEVGSSWMMRKLRTWPESRGSGLGAADVAPFQRALSMEVREERSRARALAGRPVG